MSSDGFFLVWIETLYMIPLFSLIRLSPGEYYIPAFWPSAIEHIVKYISGSIQSSESKKSNIFSGGIFYPRVHAIPRLAFALCTTFIRESEFAYLSHISGQLSGEPSSTRIISKFCNVLI